MRSSSAANMSMSSSSNGMMEDECATVKQFECHEPRESVSELENQYNMSNHKATNVLILNELDINKLVSHTCNNNKGFNGEVSSMANSSQINRDHDLLVQQLSSSS